MKGNILVTGKVLLGVLFLMSASAAWAESRNGDSVPDDKVDASKYHKTSTPALAGTVAKTGQTNCYDAEGNPIDCEGTGQDGDYRKGVSYPKPRFTEARDGTVTDNLTGLIWLKNADCFNVRTWNEALSDSNSLADEQCGLTDGSSEGDWRLANARELSSLIDFGRFNIALPAGHPFINVQPDSYWSSTTSTNNAETAWRLCIHCGHLSPDNKTDDHYVWPVRGGQ